MAIVDVGSPPQRYVDLRRLPWDVIRSSALIVRLRADFAPLARPAMVVWVLPDQATWKLAELSDDEHLELWQFFKALAGGAQHAVFVDGARPGMKTTAAIERCGFVVAIAWPSIILTEAGEARTVSAADLFTTGGAERPRG